jgi:hypothetical protein
MKLSWMAQKSSFRSFFHAAASHAHHLPFVEGGHHHEIATSNTDQETDREGHRAVIDHRPWVDHDEDFPRADVLDHHLADTGADIEAGEVEVAGEVSVVVATTMDTGLDAHCLARDPDRLGEACHIHDPGQGALHRGAAEAEVELQVATEGESLPHEEAVAVAVAVVEGAPAIVRTVATVAAGAGAGAEGAVLPGDRNAAGTITRLRKQLARDSAGIAIITALHI